MARYNIDNPLSDDGRNKLNAMFEELYKEYTEAGLNAKDAREKAVKAVADSILAKDIAETTRQEMLDIIREQTRNGDLAPEIAQARGGKQTLGDRLNSTDQQLAQRPTGTDLINALTPKANKTEVEKKADLSYVDQLISQLGELKVSGVYPILNDLEADLPNGGEGVYVITENGHWYFWNGNSWVSGGIFQSNQWINALTTQDSLWEVN